LVKQTLDKPIGDQKFLGISGDWKFFPKSREKWGARVREPPQLCYQAGFILAEMVLPQNRLKNPSRRAPLRGKKPPGKEDKKDPFGGPENPPGDKDNSIWRETRAW